MAAKLLSVACLLAYVSLASYATIIEVEKKFCQIYVYNYKPVTSSRLRERHMFVCCNNGEEKTCTGVTYQKPSQHQDFCHGFIIKDPASSWIEPADDIIARPGPFYCGGCCGQHMAWSACDEERSKRHLDKCWNWALCFQKQCQKIVSLVQHHEPLKCTLPPAPYLKHFLIELQTLPPNLPHSRTLPSSSSDARVTSSQAKQSPSINTSTYRVNVTLFSCSNINCEEMSAEESCRHHCCEKYCCLQDSAIYYPDEYIIGMTRTAFTALIIVIIVSCTVIVLVIALLLKRRSKMTCHQQTMTAVPQHDTKILVTEQENDSDDGDDL